MTKYHKVKKISGPVSPQAEMGGHSIDSLAEQLSLGSLSFNATLATEQGIPMIEQEYCSYTKSQRERGGTNLLIYWGVRLIYYLI